MDEKGFRKSSLEEKPQNKHWESMRHLRENVNMKELGKKKWPFNCLMCNP